MNPKNQEKKNMGRRDQYGSLQREEESCEDDNNAAGSDRHRMDSGKKHKGKKPVGEEDYSDSESESGSDTGSESEENDRRGRRRSEKRERKSRKRHSRSRSRSYDLGSNSESDSDSGSGSEESGGEVESQSEEERRRKRKERKRRREREEEKRRRREKEKKRRKEREEEEERRRKKRKKKKKKENEKKKREKVERGKTGAVTNSWGKYGIIRETDMWNKRPEFTAWLAEVKQVNLEHLANWEEKQMFKEFMEDHNTATFPSKKYYNLDAYYKHQMEKEMKKGTKKVQETERTVFNDEEQRRQELLRDREIQKEAEVEALKLSMRSGMAQAMKEQAQLREQMAYLYKLGKFEEAAAIQRRLDPDVPM